MLDIDVTATGMTVALPTMDTTSLPPAGGDASPPTLEPVPMVDAGPTFEAREADARAAYTRPRFSLRDLADESIEIDILLTAADGELTPELEARLDVLMERLTRKADGIGDYRQAVLLEIDGVKTEEKRLAERRRKQEAACDRWQRRTMDYMKRMGREKIAGDYWTARVQPNPPKLIVHAPESEVPAPYRTEKTEVVVSVDTAAMKKDLVTYEKDLAAWENAMEIHPERAAAALAADGTILPEPVRPTRPVAEAVAVLTRDSSLRLG